MNPTQTHKVFGQGVRGMLAVAIAASAVSTASVKAGPTEDTIAAAMNATGIVSGVTGKTVKTKDQSFNPPSSFNQAMIASFSITFSNPNIASVASKITASKLFAFYQKGLPEYSPNLAQLAVSAALKEVGNTLKYKDVTAKAKDAAKIGSLAIKNGLKAYKSGTRNSGWTGFTSTTAAVIEANVANISYQTNAALVGASAETKVAVIANMTKSLVKATAKFKKTGALGSSAAVVGFVGQVGAVLDGVNTETTAVIQNAVKNDKKSFIQIAEAAAYAAYAVYKQNNPSGLSVAAWVALNKGDIFAAVKNGYGKKADDFLAQIETAITSGATSANLGEVKFGARDLSTVGNPLVINKGDQAPVTKITNS